MRGGLEQADIWLADPFGALLHSATLLGGLGAEVGRSPTSGLLVGGSGDRLPHRPGAGPWQACAPGRLAIGERIAAVTRGRDLANGGANNVRGHRQMSMENDQFCTPSGLGAAAAVDVHGRSSADF